MNSRALESEVAAMQSRIQSEGGAFPDYELKAKGDAYKADVIYQAIKILQEYRKNETKPQTAVIRPNQK